MKNCLVIYYSRTGITRTVAEAIARRCGGDIGAIRDPSPRDGAFGLARSAWQAWRRIQPDIAAPIQNAGHYDLVVLGTPVWLGTLAAPMRTYIHRNRHAFQRVAAFCTMGGVDGGRTLDDIARLCGQPLAARLALPDGDVARGGQHERVAAFMGLLDLVS